MCVVPCDTDCIADKAGITNLVWESGRYVPGLRPIFQKRSERVKWHACPTKQKDFFSRGKSCDPPAPTTATTSQAIHPMAKAPMLALRAIQTARLKINATLILRNISTSSAVSPANAPPTSSSSSHIEYLPPYSCSIPKKMSCHRWQLRNRIIHLLREDLVCLTSPPGPPRASPDRKPCRQ
jgi:hypothetical protein